MFIAIKIYKCPEAKTIKFPAKMCKETKTEQTKQRHVEISFQIAVKIPLEIL